jgi:hypothetical protein
MPEQGEDHSMANSSQDQPTTTNIVQQADASKRWFGIRLVITFAAFILIAILIFVILTYFKILVSQWLVPLFGGTGTFVTTTLFDKDFQQSFRKWLTNLLFGNTEEKTKDDKDSKNTPQPNITINVSPTITNMNTTTSASNSSVQPVLASPATRQQIASTAAHLPSSSGSIFFPNMKLTDPSEFYGRMLERTQLLSRTRHGGCTSIVGPRRSGKTWLMSYLRLVADEQLGANFRIGYMSAALPSCAKRAGFTKEALQALGYPTYSLPASPDLGLLEHCVRDVVAQKQTPILCIDEFEGLTPQPEFDLQFFEGLRAITEIGLALVVLSKEPLIDLVSESTRTSPFFNVFLQLTLHPFERAETEQFVQQKGKQAQLSEQERAYLLAYAQTAKKQFPPLRLQLVGEMLLNEKRAEDQQHYRPHDPEYWQAFKQRVDAAYRGMVKS